MFTTKPCPLVPHPQIFWNSSRVGGSINGSNSFLSYVNEMEVVWDLSLKKKKNHQNLNKQTKNHQITKKLHSCSKGRWGSPEFALKTLWPGQKWD